MEPFTIITPVSKNNNDLSFTADSLIDVATKLEFEWLVVCPQFEYDAIVNNDSLIKVPNVRVICEERNSIYGAYNTALNNITSKYYLPLSAGDSILKDSLDCLTNALNDLKLNDWYIVFFSVLKSGGVIKAQDSILSLIRTSGFSSGHSSSCIISMDAHKFYGFYDESFKLAADNYFFERVYKGSKNRIHWISGCILGYFKGGGISVQNMDKTIRELYLTRVKAGRSKHKEGFIYLYRFLKYIYLSRKPK